MELIRQDYCFKQFHAVELYQKSKTMLCKVNSACSSQEEIVGYDCP